MPRINSSIAKVLKMNSDHCQETAGWYHGWQKLELQDGLFMPLRMSWILFNMVILYSYEWNGYTRSKRWIQSAFRKKCLQDYKKCFLCSLYVPPFSGMPLFKLSDTQRTTDVCLCLVILCKWIIVDNRTLISHLT